MKKTMARRKILKTNAQGRAARFMKYKIAFVIRDETYIVFSGNTILVSDLSESAAERLAHFLNAQEFLNTDSRVRSEHVKPKLEFDFDAIYAMFPRKIGKKTGYERLRKEITSIEKYELLRLAVENYCSIAEGTEPKYILHFSTFCNRWADYIPEDTVSVSGPQQLSIDEISKLVDH